MTDTLLKCLKQKQKGINGWLFHSSGMNAEIMAQQGYHSVTIDMQHGLCDYAAMVATLQTLAAYPVTPLVRVSTNDHGEITKALDAGAKGIICPMVNTAAQAKHFIESLYYPPHGSRSYGPVRAGKLQPDYFKTANDCVLGFAMIETQQAVQNLEAIASVEGLSGLYIGPSDLAISHGYAPGYDRTEPQLLACIEQTLEAAHRTGIIAAVHTNSSEYALQMLELGFDMVTLMNDLGAMQIGLEQTLAPLKERNFL